MATAALILYLVFVALGFGWRSWVAHRATGSTGFRGISGRPGSLEWFAGVGFAGAVIVGVVAPVLQAAGVLEPVHALQASWVQACGIAAAITGLALTLYAQRDMGESWRIGVDPGEATTLVRTGVFGVVRNPIFTAMAIFATGVALMAPNPMALAGWATLVAAIGVQVRRVEEPYLLHNHGDHYRAYAQQVGRFLPGIGRM